jgi:hypothetical protein
MPTADHCSECGSPTLVEISPGQLQCHYCSAVFRAPRLEGASVRIAKGANVIFGKNAHVIIKGGLQIDDGAQVAIEGELTILAPGDPERIRAAREKT